MGKGDSNVVELKPQAGRTGPKGRRAPSKAKPVAAAPAGIADVTEAIRKEMHMNAETVLKSIEAITPAVEKVTADAFAQGKANFETVTAKSQEVMGNAMKSMTEMTEFAKGNVDAMMASAKAATTGVETIAGVVVEHGKKSFEEATAAMKAMAAAKSPSEFFQLQNDFAKGRFDHMVAMWSQMSETMLKVAGDVSQPVSSRLAIAGEAMKGLISR
jgi:phasin family protein